MSAIAPALICHEVRNSGEGASVDRVDLDPDAPAASSDGDAFNTANDGHHRPPTVLVNGRSTSAISLGRIDWIRPPNPAPAPVTSPAQTALVASEQALAHADLPTEKSEQRGLVSRYVELLQRRHGIANDVALAVALATLSAAAGVGRTLRNPLGGTVTPALNFIVEDPVNARVRRAARQAVGPLQQKVDAQILAHQVAGDKYLRQSRMELEGECARALGRLRSLPTKIPEPLCIPATAEERAGDTLSVAIEGAQPVAEAMQLHGFAERPFVVTDGLSTRDIADLPRRSFDGALFNYSPGGDALRQLAAMPAAQRREVLRFMVAAWQGESFAAGPGTIITPTLTNLWLCDSGDTLRLGSNPAVAASGWLETVLVVANDPAERVTGQGCTATGADDDWRKLVGVVMGERIMGETCEHELSEPAAKRFLAFQADTVRRQTAGTQKFTAWWPEQVLKIALLLHLDTPYSEVPEEIGLTTMEKAISVMERLGNAQLGVIESSASPRDDFDAQIEVMVAKVRLNGPMPKWNLFRRYHKQRAEVMEPVLARCCERNLLQVEGDLVRLADSTP